MVARAVCCGGVAGVAWAHPQPERGPKAGAAQTHEAHLTRGGGRPALTSRKVTVLRGATVFDGSGRPASKDAVVLIRNDRIWADGLWSVSDRQLNWTRAASSQHSVVLTHCAAEQLGVEGMSRRRLPAEQLSAFMSSLANRALAKY